MGYELHITRRENWIDEDVSKMITLEEWKNYIANDSEMRLDGYAEATTSNGESVNCSSEGLAVWMGYSKNHIDGNYAWFDYNSGNIDVKNPDPEIIGKMLQIALKLEATVQGDDGEMYGRNTHEPASQSSSSSPEKETKKRRWKLW
jgi:hypothetical protein